MTSPSYTPLAWNLNTNFVGKTILHYPECSSTQDLLKQWAQTSDVEGWVIIADRQHSGRGQHQRTWTDLGGNQLFISLCDPFSYPLQVVPIMNMWIAVILLETLLSMDPSLELAIKWPNDIYIQNKKLGGILSELFVQAKKATVHIGCGINISQMDHPSLPNAISLEQVGLDTDRMAFTKKFLQRLDRELQQSSYCVTFDYIEKTYLQHALYKNQMVRVTTPKSDIQGKIIGLSKEGGLLLETSNGDKVQTVSGKLSALAHEQQK